MPVIAFFSASHSIAEEITAEVAAELGYRRIDRDVLDACSSRFNIPADQLVRAMEGPPFAFNKFTRKRERSLACLRVSLAEALREDGLVLHGFTTHLIPRGITHTLKVCLLADPEQRAHHLAAGSKMSMKEAHRAVRDSDSDRLQWTRFLFGLSPWDKGLYDMKIPMRTGGRTEVTEIAQRIVENARKDALEVTEQSRRAVADFQLAAGAGLVLAEGGHFHAVTCSGGVITITIDEYVLRLEHLEDELKQIVSTIDGVASIETRTGPNYRPASMFAPLDVDMPAKILLVDDEKDFAMTLSERLEMRDMAPAIAYNGEEALNILAEEEPEVMVLDLKMPGIDGFGVLRKVKAEHPDVEVIILTGHGSEKDRNLCMDLGAFAYLEKPVDIELLSSTMKAAYDKIKNRKKAAK